MLSKLKMATFHLQAMSKRLGGRQPIRLCRAAVSNAVDIDVPPAAHSMRATENGFEQPRLIARVVANRRARVQTVFNCRGPIRVVD